MNVYCDTLIRRGGWREDLILQRCVAPIGPRNTWSNAAYPLAGVGVISGKEGIAFFLLLLLLGVGSGLYHAYKTAAANKLDHYGMYVVFIGLLVYTLAGSSPTTPWLMLGIAIPGGLLTYRSKLNLNIPMGLTLGTSALINITLGDLKLVILSLLFFVLAYGFWIADRKGLSFIGLWGHAVWHVLTAIAIVLMFLARGT